MTSLDELPSTDVLSPQQLDEWIKKAEEPDQLGDSDVGLPSNDEDNSENRVASIVTAEDQEELGLESSDDPIYEVKASVAEQTAAEIEIEVQEVEDPGSDAKEEAVSEDDEDKQEK